MISVVCDRCGTPVELPFHPIPGPALATKTPKSMGCAMTVPVQEGGGFRFQASHLCMDCLQALAVWMRNSTPGKRCCKRHPGVR